jgi:hypothetical protein
MQRLKQILVALIIAIFSSCTGPKNSASETFLELFQEISFDTLHVYSPCDKPDGRKFEGKIMDSTFYEFFELDAWQLSNLKWQDFYKCYKFEMSDTLTGLIVRRPSQYSETAIDLNVWNNRTEKIINTINLSDGFADGMWFFMMDSWIVDNYENNKFAIVTRRMSWWEEDVDPTPENPQGLGEEHIDDTTIVYVANGANFQISNFVIDTAQFKLLDWDLD